MSEYAPDALVKAGKLLASRVSGGQFAGVLGDKNHTYGYHRARRALSGNDYSVKQADDKRGDGWAASAIDVSFWGDLGGLHAVTKRLVDATAAGDKRLKPLREFFGSTNSRPGSGGGLTGTVTGRDVRTKKSVSSDDSHLFHVHLSIYRRWANDYEAVRGVIDVASGKTGDEVDKKDIQQIWHTDDTLKTSGMGYGTDYVKKNPGMSAATVLGLNRRDTRDVLSEQKKTNKLLERQAKLLESLVKKLG